MAAHPKAWYCGPSFAGIAGSNPAGGAWMSVSCECCVPVTGLCNGPIPCPGESLRVCVGEFNVIRCCNSTVPTVSREREVRLRKKKVRRRE